MDLRQWPKSGHQTGADPQRVDVSVHALSHVGTSQILEAGTVEYANQSICVTNKPIDMSGGEAIVALERPQIALSSLHGLFGVVKTKGGVEE